MYSKFVLFSCRKTDFISWQHTSESSDTQMEHLNILTVESVKLLLVRINMGVKVGLVHEKRCAVTCFRGRGKVSLNINLSTNTNKELFHIHTNACGDAETQQDEKMT